MDDQTLKFIAKTTKGATMALANVKEALFKSYEEDEKYTEWREQAVKTHQARYFLEAIVICVNAINAQLRHGLYRKSLLSNMKAMGIAMADNYLSELLTNYENPLVGKVDDRKVFQEALRLHVIDKSLYSRLNGLYDERNKLMHRLFSGSLSPNSPNQELENLSLKYLQLMVDCWAELIKITEEMGNEIKKIGAEL